VTTHNAAFTYKGKAVDVKQPRRSFGGSLALHPLYAGRTP
jgi:hypothetical protein